MRSPRGGFTMKSYRRPVWMTLMFFSLMIFACVTINIYFPAEQVESVAGEIVDEIRGQKPGDIKSNLLNRTFFAFFAPVAVAAEPLTVSNPGIRMLKQQMKARYAQMRPFYQKGVLKEDNNGYVSLSSTAGLGLKEKRNLTNLVAAENSDRRKLYGEIAKAMKIDSSQVGRIGEVFAKEWQKPVR
jgi:uncharacterized protein